MSSLTNFAHVYKNADHYGIKAILAEHLGLDPSAPMPLVFPHGIDYFQAKVLCDLHCHEPLYAALREDIHEAAAPLRGTLRFPHPWLLLIGENRPALGEGTLFIAPSPGHDNYAGLYDGIQAQDFAKPWGILLKDRGLIEEDFAWWASRGFRTHCLGNHTNTNYFQDLKEILTGYRQVATAHFTSAAFFAASLSMRVRIITDVCTSTNDYLEYGQHSSANHVEDRGGRIRAVWSKLTSSNLDTSREVALHFLGSAFMANREALKERYVEALRKIEKPVHLYPLKSAHLYGVLVKLVELGIPVHRLYPFPVRKLLTRLRAAFGYYPCLLIREANFHDFGIVEGKRYYQETPMWRLNPLLKVHMGGSRFLPRWRFAKRRTAASVVGKRT